MGRKKSTSGKALFGTEWLKMIPSVSVGWSPDVTAMYTAASYILHKVGLYTWEPYSAQPTKRASLAANFILLLLTQGFTFPDQMSPKINVICILLLWRVLHMHENNTGINTWKPVLSSSRPQVRNNSHSHMTERKPTSTIFTTSADRWEFKNQSSCSPLDQVWLQKKYLGTPVCFTFLAQSTARRKHCVTQNVWKMQQQCHNCTSCKISKNISTVLRL